MERRSIRTIPRLTDFLKVLEGPVYKAAAISEEGQDGRTDKFHHLGGIMFVPLDKGCRFPSALEDARTFALKRERLETARGLEPIRLIETAQCFPGGLAVSSL